MKNKVGMKNDHSVTEIRCSNQIGTRLPWTLAIVVTVVIAINVPAIIIIILSFPSRLLPLSKQKSVWFCPH